jgi:hypothetical protein
MNSIHLAQHMGLCEDGNEFYLSLLAAEEGLCLTFYRTPANRVL